MTRITLYSAFAIILFAAPAWPQPALDIALPPIDIIGDAPLAGPGADGGKIPTPVTVLHQQELRRGGDANVVRAMEQNVPGLVLDSASGNPSQPNIFLHGFQISPLQGTAQGLAVYMNGIRFNQAFGDTVNWDLVPDIAVDSMDIAGANPAFGLNALGGSIAVRLKDGFSYQGAEAVMTGGSFGRMRGQFQYGVRSGDVAAYVAGSAEHQRGWRNDQSSELQNFHGDLGWRGGTGEVHVSLTAAHSILNGPGTSPVELLAAAPAAQFTAPNNMSNQYFQTAVNGRFDVSDTASLRAVLYANRFHQTVLNGNIPELGPCGNGYLCTDAGATATTTGGVPITDFLNGGQYGQLDRQVTDTTGYGTSVQLTDTRPLLDRTNRFVAGLSFDGAQTRFGATSAIGGLTDSGRAFIGPGIPIDLADGSIAPVNTLIGTAYYGAYAVDTFQPIPRLSVTLAGRFNLAAIDLTDRIGTALNGQHQYARLNPAVGGTYEVAPWLTAYAGYAEANRAPTPAELSCASAAAPCSLANFFVGDPGLKQVVARTVEMGLRGRYAPAEGQVLTYSAGLFRSNLDDDIVFVNSAVVGRAFFQNAGRTRRQGMDASVTWKTARLTIYANYSLTDATFQQGFVASSPNNPAASPAGTITVRPGNRLPGIPAQVAKAGVRYGVEDQWSVGATVVAASGVRLFGDEANLTPPLPGYVRLDLDAKYRLTPHAEIFALIENTTNSRYYTYGTFSPTSSVSLIEAPGATNPRSYSPAAPIGCFAGVRITF